MIALGWLWALVVSGLLAGCLVALLNTGDSTEAHEVRGLAMGLMLAAVMVAIVAGAASLPGLRGT